MRYPALLYGLFAVFGCCVALTEQPWLVAIPVSCLILPIITQNDYSLRGRMAFALLIGFGYCAYTSNHLSVPPLPAHGITGRALLRIHSMSHVQVAYGPAWIIKGDLQSFVPIDDDEALIKNAAYNMTLPDMEISELPNPNWSYLVDGTLRERASGSYQLSVKRATEWHPVATSWNFAYWRHLAKEEVKHYIEKQIPDTQSAQFLIGLTTGEFADKHIRRALGRFGLQHILAISGFHFAILAALLSAMLCWCLPYRQGAATTLALLTGYMLFLGYGASILRAFITAAISQFGKLVQRPPCALNSMGMAMLIIVAYDPTSTLSPAFQLSFLATAAILILYPLCLEMIEKFWPKRSLESLVAMTRLDQHGYILMTLLRQAVALTTSVHLATVPVCLYYFGQFPLFSLIYNLFFPFLVSVSLALLLIASLFNPLLPTIAYHAHHFNSWYTQRILNLTLNAPHTWDVTLSTHALSETTVIIFCCVLFLLAVALDFHHREHRGL
jgi:competence protein ComEC